MFLGFDIGGTKCAVVLGGADEKNGLFIAAKLVLPTNLPPFEMIGSLFAGAESLLEKNGLTKTRIEGIGISCGGPLNSKTGAILSPPNLPGWNNIPITTLAEKHFGKKAFLQNDANACAVAEWKYGAGRGLENIIFLTFGTGLGAGLIINGRLYSGLTDAAGEAGHMRLTETGPVGFGKAGSFEGYCSGGGIAQLAQMKAREQLQMGRKTGFCNSMEELPAITAKAVAEAAYEGDATAIDVYKTSGHYLGKGLSLLIDLLNPEMIILGGIYGRAQSLIEPSMTSVIEQEALPASFKACKIVPALLGEQIGDYAALALADMK